MGKYMGTLTFCREEAHIDFNWRVMYVGVGPFVGHDGLGGRLEIIKAFEEEEFWAWVYNYLFFRNHNNIHNNVIYETMEMKIRSIPMKMLSHFCQNEWIESYIFLGENVKLRCWKPL
jgi:hypothetical protein